MSDWDEDFDSFCLDEEKEEEKVFFTRPDSFYSPGNEVKIFKNFLMSKDPDAQVFCNCIDGEHHHIEGTGIHSCKITSSNVPLAEFYGTKLDYLKRGIQSGVKKGIPLMKTSIGKVYRGWQNVGNIVSGSGIYKKEYKNLQTPRIEWSVEKLNKVTEQISAKLRRKDISHEIGETLVTNQREIEIFWEKPRNFRKWNFDGSIFISIVSQNIISIEIELRFNNTHTAGEYVRNRIVKPLLDVIELTIKPLTLKI